MSGFCRRHSRIKRVLRPKRAGRISTSRRQSYARSFILCSRSERSTPTTTICIATLLFAASRVGAAFTTRKLTPLENPILPDAERDKSACAACKPNPLTTRSQHLSLSDSAPV